MIKSFAKRLVLSRLRAAGYVVARPVIDHPSETSKHRAVLQDFCRGAGIDIGFGGDAITEAAVRVDLPQPYTRVGVAPVQLGGDCRDLYWFNDGVLDFVYSSHVLEDFPESETASILREWVRVLRPGGTLVLLLPDQQRYLAFCRKTGQISPEGVVGNPHHAIAHFGLDYVRSVVATLGNMNLLREFPALDEYSFAAVFQKVA